MNKRMCSEIKMHPWKDENRPCMCWCPGTMGNEYSGMASEYLTSSPTSRQLEHFHWCPCLSNGLEGRHDMVIFPWVLQIPITSAEPGSSTYCIWTLSSWDFTLMTLVESYREKLKKCHVDEPAAGLARPLSISGPRHAILQQEGIVRLQQVRVVALSRRKNYSTACGCLFSVAEERKADRLLPRAFRDIRQVT